MDYESFINSVTRMDFVENTKEADALIKGVFGILASELDEVHARVLTENLPEPLTFEKLRGRQRYPLMITFEQYLETLSAEFGISRQEAETAVNSLFAMMLEAADSAAFSSIKESLPEDWASAMEGIYAQQGG